MSKIRLDKLISNQLLISRSLVRTGIYRGKATVNGDIVRDPSAQVDTEWSVSYDGMSVNFKEHIYIMMNKPQGVVSATTDPKIKTVIDIVPENLKRKNLFPAGRLDRDTVGFMLITDDGDFAHRILSPSKHVPKTYIANLRDKLSEEAVVGIVHKIIVADSRADKDLFDFRYFANFIQKLKIIRMVNL